jgi:hypothetical protein
MLQGQQLKHRLFLVPFDTSMPYIPYSSSMMEMTTSDKGADTSGGEKKTLTWVTKLRQWFSRQPSEENPETQAAGQPDANAATSPPGEAETTSHDEQVSLATRRDE